MARRTSTRELANTATATIETPVAKPKKEKLPTVCECGCEGTTAGGRFLPGHDAKYKSALLKRHDAGDTTATQELIERGWYSESRLESRNSKTTTVEDRKLARLRAQLERIDAQIAALQDKRTQLVAETEAVSGKVEG